MSFLGFGKVCTVDLTHDAGDAQPMVSVKNEQGTAHEHLPLFSTGRTIAGKVHVAPIPGKRFEHRGVRVELIGQIERYGDRSVVDFLASTRDLEPPGELSAPKSLGFEFKHVEMQHESYHGINVRLRYFLRVVVSRSYASGVAQEFKFWVQNPVPAVPEMNNSIRMEVGIEDCLHIEFEYAKAKYSLKDVVVGKIYFLLVKIKIKHMELEIRRRESTEGGASAHNESETIAKYEVMDGAPVRGESIPVRLFLSPYDLTPTYKNVNNRFSVKYYLNLVLVDEWDRRYFKQQEITLYRATQ